ncbi:MAG TPA: sulfatase-like hydrolase/transferase [Opitutaceae bacterium]
MRPPDILWIVTTQWRADATGYAGNRQARTPCLDALAAQAVNYGQAVTPHPFGPFARAALLTGVPSPENGVRDYFDPLPRGTRTVAHALKDRGYQTAFFGKWHLARRDPRQPLVGESHARMVVDPADRGGFDFWEGFESGFLLNNPWLHGTRLPELTRFPGYQSDVLCERAAAWLPAASTSPWFAVVSLEAPHPPYDAPAAGIVPRSIDPGPSVPREAASRAARELAGYHAHLEATDRAIGRLLAACPPDTAVVFTSVHGDMHGAHGLFRKGWPHEESVRVPLLVRSPRDVGGREDLAPISLLDLPAQACAWAENRTWTAPREAARISMPSVVALPDQCDRIWHGVRTPRRKLVLNADGSPWLFFDLEHDPEERTNLAGDASRAGEIAALRPLASPRP